MCRVWRKKWQFHYPFRISLRARLIIYSARKSNDLAYSIYLTVHRASFDIAFEARVKDTHRATNTENRSRIIDHVHLIHLLGDNFISAGNLVSPRSQACPFTSFKQTSVESALGERRRRSALMIPDTAVGDARIAGQAKGRGYPRDFVRG